MWSKFLYNIDDKLIHDISQDGIKNKNKIIDSLAAGFFKDMQHLLDPTQYSDPTNIEHTDLTKTEKAFWCDFAEGIPDKLSSLSLFIRPFEDFCRTCIITESEIAVLVKMDHDRYYSGFTSNELTNIHSGTLKSKVLPSIKSFQVIVKDWKRFSLEINYLIPVQLKKIGYEVIRYEEAAEINMSMVKKLARAIHSRYLHEIRNRTKGPEGSYSTVDSRDKYTSDFDDLPDEIKNSNTDNAYHIPTKLLSIGYKIRQVKKNYKPLALHLNGDEIEIMSRVEHLRWCWEKRLNGWIFGGSKDEIRKTHPSLIPYEELSESEKEKDRQLVKLIPALLQDIRFEAYPVSPNRIHKLSYAIKPQSSIQKILDETRELNEQIRKLVILTPEAEEMVKIRNSKIEEAIIEVRESYNYAQHIQETFLPDDHYVRECFPDSFILFKPKDLISGDFYFFSKHDDLIIFAAADCTGHGIPGALLSMIGYGMLDQAVNEINLTDPSTILQHVYTKIHRFLRNDSKGTGISDDMDIVLAVLNIRSNIITFSGVKNPLYQITKGELVVHRAKNILSECIKEGECRFTSEKIQMNIGDTIYIFTDGYTDQFGGKYHKRYLSGRFELFLKSLQEYSLPEQGDRLYEEIERWREEKPEDQTDDILVIGIRL